MQVPLKLDTVTNGGSQYLKFWYNGGYDYIKSPILPYCYSKQVPPSNAKVTEVDKTLLYDNEYSGTLYKVEFGNEYDLRESVGNEGYFETRIPLKNRVFTSMPELLEKYANTDDVKLLKFDIETDSYLTFPNPKENAIIAIGIQLNDEAIEIKMAESHDDDFELLWWFIHKIKDLDPDVYVQYNGNFFDWPYIFERCRQNRISITEFSRDKSEPFVKEVLVQGKKDHNEIYFGGRSNYDIYIRSVLKDQYLFKASPKNKQMKKIAKLYKLDNIIEEPPEVMSNMRSIVNTEQLYNYLYSDMRCTTHLANIYFPAIVGMAEQVKITLDDCINASPSLLPESLFSREFGNRDIVSDATVGEAYPELAENKQGALVGCYQPGLYKYGIRKLDVQSYYPNLIRTLNLCPTTTRIYDVREEMEEFNAQMTDDNFLYLSIPDNKMEKQIIIEIDFNKRGFTSQFVDENMEARLEMKKKLKELSPSDPEYALLDVNQLNLKVIMNSVTGYFGMKYAKFGSIACYIAITGTGRYLIQKLIDYVDSCIALDTDGIVVNSNETVEEVNEWMSKHVTECLQVPRNYIILEEETYKSAYFRDGSKQYLMIEENKDGEDELVIHGISLKGSNLPQLYSNIIEKVGFKMLTTDDDLTQYIEPFYDTKQWSLNDIKKNTKVRPPDEYKTGSPIGKQLALQYEERFGSPITNETKMGYVKIRTKHGSQYRLVTILDKIDDYPELDIDYYKNTVDNALERLSLAHLIPGKKGQQASLFNF